MPSLPPPDEAGAVADTVQPDTARTPRERALDRLRALPMSPVQPDTVAADTAAPDTDADPTDAAPDDAADRDPAAAPDDRATPGVIPPLPRADPTPGVELEGGVIVVRPRARPPDTTDVVRDEESVRAALARLEGYVTTEYRGDSAEFEGTGRRLRLMGDSRVSRDGHAIETDSLLVYTGETGMVCGYGTPVLSGDIDPVESDRVCYDIDRGVGMAERARTTFTQGGTWYVRGPENRVFLLTRNGRNEMYGEKAQFTSCDLPEPHYVFQARSLKMVQNDMMVARNVTLRFEDVPVFWLPWMVQSMKPDRRSGLLTPQFGVNDIVRNNTGYNRRISNLGYYWAINDYMSALAAFEWFSNNYTAVEGNLTYRWTRQFLQGRVAVKQFWRETEFGRSSRSMTINTSNNWKPDERTQLQVSGDYATSTALVRDYSYDPRELNRSIRSSASMNRSFDWGSMTLGAQRQQQITDDRIDLTLPSLGLTLRPITLFSNDDGTRSLTWSGRGQTDRKLRQVNHDLTPTARGQETTTANASHSLSFGRLSLSQGMDFRDNLTVARPVPGTPTDTIPARSEQALGWTTSLSFQQSLWTGTTLSPSLSVQGRQIRDDSITSGVSVAEPLRIAAGASLGTTIFGFWPGFGDYERIRHKISPSLNWSYSPQPRTSILQDSIFRTRNLREQNIIGLSFNQTFEAKVRDDTTAERQDGRTAEQQGGGAAEQQDGGTAEGQDGATAVAQERGERGEPGEPRRMPTSRTVNLLSINTSTRFQYDFVRAREEGRGFQNDEVSNSIRSDLLPGLQLGMTHSLFEKGEAAEPGGLEPRRFRPFLTRLSTSFSIDQNFWLIRLLGLTGSVPEDEGEDAAASDVGADERVDLDQRDPGSGSMVPRAGDPGRGMGVSAPAGGWRATLSYSLHRPRPTAASTILQARGQQTLNGSLAFRPTEHWRVNWTTAYSFTTGDFDSHVLTLTRDLHRWQANFDFIKSPNGNFAMQFRVHLLDNPDLKVDYDQRTDPSDRLRMAQPAGAQ